MFTDRRAEADVVALLNAWSVGDALERSLRCGGYLLDRYYGGDPGAFRRHGRKPNSLRSIAHHPDLAVSAATVWRMVALAAQDRSLPEDLRGSLTHPQRMALLPVSNPEVRAALGREAVASGATGDVVRERVKASIGPIRSGRPPAPPGVRYANRMTQVLEEAEHAFRGVRLSEPERAALRRVDLSWRTMSARWTQPGGAT